MRVHEYLLQTECGYKSGQPYWDRVRDVDNFAGSVIFDPVTGFGGEGSECVLDGPFTNLRMHINGTSTSANYCLSRAFNATAFTTAKQENIDEASNSRSMRTAILATRRCHIRQVILALVVQ